MYIALYFYSQQYFFLLIKNLKGYYTSKTVKMFCQNIKEICMNLNDGLGVTDVYEMGKWLRRGREGYLKRQIICVYFQLRTERRDS